MHVHGDSVEHAAGCGRHPDEVAIELVGLDLKRDTEQVRLVRNANDMWDLLAVRWQRLEQRHELAQRTKDRIDHGGVRRRRRIETRDHAKWLRTARGRGERGRRTESELRADPHADELWQMLHGPGTRRPRGAAAPSGQRGAAVKRRGVADQRHWPRRSWAGCRRPPGCNRRGRASRR